MTRSLWRSAARVVVVALAGSAMAAVASVGSPARAMDGPFDGVIGLWGGNGTVTYASGTKERLRCRAQYVQNSADNLQQALRCASDSYTFQINAFFQHTEGDLRGRWEELVLDISGSVSGTADNGVIEGHLNGPGFVAELIVVTEGDRQKVQILTPDQEIRAVDIEVRKSRDR